MSDPATFVKDIMSNARQARDELQKHPMIKDYKDWKAGMSNSMLAIDKADCTVGRVVFPFIHQPSLRKVFYQNRLNAYTTFVQEYTE